MFSLCSRACGGLQLPACFFEGHSLPHPCLRAKLHPYQPPLLPAAASPSSALSPPPFPLINFPHFFPLAPALPPFVSAGSRLPTGPLRAAGLSRSLLRRSELISCILDRPAAWGHTLPEDRSIHAGGNRGAGARGPRPGARSRAGGERRGELTGVDDGMA